MRTHTQCAPVLRPPKEHAPDGNGKIERALEIRESTRKAREGKPVVFPARRAWS